MRRERFGRFRWSWLALAAPLLAGCPRATRLPVVPAAEVDFRALLRDALLAQAAYEDAAAVRLAWGGPAQVYVKDLPSVQNRYFIAADTSSAAQVLGVRGTANLQNALIDAQVMDDPEPETGARLHHGFIAPSWAVLADALPRLDKGRPVRVVGHSLGGAEAVIIGRLLQLRGYAVEKVVTFGQPQLTNGKGADRFKDLPLLRVVDDKDVVPFLPPADLVPLLNSYRPFGPVIVLFEGSKYGRPAERVASPERIRAFLDGLRSGAVPPEIAEHFIATYVARLAAKADGGVEAP